MGSTKTVLLVLLAAVVAVAAAAVLNMGRSGDGGDDGLPGRYDAFAKCLSDAGVKMYGAYWCPHCKNQKDAFGSSWKFVDSVECSLPNRAGQTELCSKEGIKGYPTWEFKDGERAEGELSMQQLSAKSGCSLPE